MMTSKATARTARIALDNGELHLLAESTAGHYATVACAHAATIEQLGA
jgi:hypothetical protein